MHVVDPPMTMPGVTRLAVIQTFPSGMRAIGFGCPLVTMVWITTESGLVFPARSTTSTTILNFPKSKSVSIETTPATGVATRPATMTLRIESLSETVQDVWNLRLFQSWLTDRDP